MDKSSSNGRAARPATNKVPWWLLLAALGLVLAIFGRSRIDTPSRDDLAFDLSDEAPAAWADGQAPGRRSNRAFALLQADGGRFYALYGPAGGDAPVVAGVLVGDGTPVSSNLHEFSLESGALRVAAQDGRFAPARFAEADATDPVTHVPLAARYAGRLSDVLGSQAASLSVDAAGRVALATDQPHCAASGHAARHGSAELWDVSAEFGDGCAHAGEALHGHLLRRGGALVLVLPTANLSGGVVFVGTPPDCQAVVP